MRDAFRHDLKGIGADPSKCGQHFLRSGGAIMSAYSGVSNRASISPLPNTLSLYMGAVLARPPQNKLICFSDAVLLFVVEWRQNMLFLTSEVASKAEIAILSARDTTRAWVPGRASWVEM